MPTEQELARFVDANVHLCLSSLVSTLAEGNGLPREMGDLSALCGQAAELCSSVADYEEAARQAGWTVRPATVSKKGVKSDPCIVRGTAPADPENVVGFKYAETFEEACEADNLDPYQWEIFEHWAVSNWFAEQLEARGERIDRDFAGLCIWGRTTTGQSISMDAVVNAIWRDLHKEEV